MKKAVLLPWNAAAWRQSRYEPRVRKVHGPVGEPLPEDNDGGLVCLGCGHHVCSCERQKPEPREYISPRELTLMKEQLTRQQGTAPVPPNHGPAGPRTELFGIDAVRKLPGYRDMKPTVLTREMFERFWKLD